MTSGAPSYCSELVERRAVGLDIDHWRPEICRSYRADELCTRIAAPTLDERVRNYLAQFDLLTEAAAAASARSMREARSLPVLR